MSAELVRSRAAHFKKLCREAARELNTQPSDERALTLATYRLMREQLQARMLNGQFIDSKELLALTEAITALTPRSLPHITVEFVEGPIEYCPKCGWSRDEKMAAKPTSMEKLVVSTTDDVAHTSPNHRRRTPLNRIAAAKPSNC